MQMVLINLQKVRVTSILKQAIVAKEPSFTFDVFHVSSPSLYIDLFHATNKGLRKYVVLWSIFVIFLWPSFVGVVFIIGC
jgi:hypothetical protein